jgi:hypothetical protein
MPLDNVVESGDYTLRAYTGYMGNMGGDYFFRKNIRIPGMFFTG